MVWEDQRNLIIFGGIVVFLIVIAAAWNSYKQSQAGPPIICPNPNCGYRGSSHRVARGSTAAFILLLLIGVVPGLIYVVIMNGYNLVCPRCGMTSRRE